MKGATSSISDSDILLPIGATRGPSAEAGGVEYRWPGWLCLNGSRVALLSDELGGVGGDVGGGWGTIEVRFTIALLVAFFATSSSSLVHSGLSAVLCSLLTALKSSV